MQTERSRSQAARQGATAERPRDIPGKGWRAILKRTLLGFSRDNGTFIAAGVAFYAFLSIPALLTAVLSIYGLVANPNQVQQQVSSLRGLVPEQALTIVSDQLTQLSSHAGGTLTFALVFSTLFALWSGSNSVKALITSMNIAYDEREKRGFFKLNAVALGLTFCGVILAVVSIGLVVAVSALAGSFHLPGYLETLIKVVRWPVLAFVALFSLAAAYRYCPSREEPKWRWVSWGSATAAVLWLIISAGFSWYVGKFGSYDKTYGSLAAIVVLMMWFYLSAVAVLLGAKLNAEMEYQTGMDTTTGTPLPMGERGAKKADTMPGAA
jgi:membrane protein